MSTNVPPKWVWVVVLALVPSPATDASELDREKLEKQLRQHEGKRTKVCKADASRWREERKCATCHHDTMTVWALMACMDLGPKVPADPAEVSPTPDGRSRAAAWLGQQKPGESTQPRALQLFRDVRRGRATQHSCGTAAVLVGAVLLTLSDVSTRPARGHMVEQSLAQPAATAPAKKDGPDQPRRTLELLILNAQTVRPEPGVSIRAHIPARDEGKTDVDGRFRIVGTEREFTVILISIRKPGFVPVQVNWDNAGARVAVAVPREHTIRLEPASTIGGTIRDEQDQPIAGRRSAWGSRFRATASPASRGST